MNWRAARTTVSSAAARLRGAARQPVVSGGLSLSASNALGALLGFAFWITVARLYPQTSVGEASAIISLAALAGGLGSLGLGTGIVRYLRIMGSPYRRPLVRRALLISSAAGATAAATFLAVSLTAGSRMPQMWPRGLVVAGFVTATIFLAVAPVIDGFFLATRNSGQILKRNAAFHLTKLGLSALLWLAGGPGGIVFGYAIGGAGSIVTVIPSIWRWLSTSDREGQEQAINIRQVEVIKYSLANHVGAYLHTLPTWLLPIVLLGHLGPGPTAAFFIAFNVASVAFSVGVSFAMVGFAESSLSEVGEPQALRFAVRAAAAVLLPLAVGLALVAPLLLRVFGSGYLIAAGAARLLAIAVPLNGASAMLIAYFRVSRRLLAYTAFSGVLGISISSAMFFAHSLDAAAILYSLGYVPALLLAFVLLRGRFLVAPIDKPTKPS